MALCGCVILEVVFVTSLAPCIFSYLSCCSTCIVSKMLGDSKMVWATEQLVCR